LGPLLLREDRVDTPSHILRPTLRGVGARFLRRHQLTPAYLTGRELGAQLVDLRALGRALRDDFSTNHVEPRDLVVGQRERFARPHDRFDTLSRDRPATRER
jgi:hypothetical protein